MNAGDDEELARLDGKPEDQVHLASVSRLKEAGPELSAALLTGPDELRRRIFQRLVNRVTYRKEDRNIEIALVLPHPDVPLKLEAPDDMDGPHVSDPRVLDRQCPGWESNPHAPKGNRS